MNELIIQDLIKQATIRANNPLVNSDGKVVCDDWEEGVSLSKFAELIVRECMACSTWVGKVNKNAIEPIHTAHAINQRIKKLFGVEE